MRVLKIKFENWNFGKVFKNGSFENQNLENYLKMKVLKIEFENWNLKNYLKIKVLKIGIFKNYLKMESFENEI